MPKQSIIFTAEEIADILREHVARNYSITNDLKIDFSISSGYSSSDPREYSAAKLNSATVTIS